MKKRISVIVGFGILTQFYMEEEGKKFEIHKSSNR
jgi:hypothetical protein